MDTFFGESDLFGVFETSTDKPTKKRKITVEETIIETKACESYVVNN